MNDQKSSGSGRAGEQRTSRHVLRRFVSRIDRTNFICACAGVFLFSLFYFLPEFPGVFDPNNPDILVRLTRDGQLAIGLFLLAATWWIFEVVPLGVTGMAIAVIQIVFSIKRRDLPLESAFTDFFDPAVWFIFGSLVIGMVFTKTGLTRRMAYKMIGLLGERTSMIYLGSFLMILLLTLLMAYTAVAATIFPLLMAVYALYEESEKPSNFGKGLFVGMAYACGAGSIVTLLGSSRAAMMVGFFKHMTRSLEFPAGKEITFFGLMYYMLPLGLVMVFVLWGLIMVRFRPEKAAIPGLHERSKQLYARLGPITLPEIASLAIILLAILVLGVRSLFPAMQAVDKSAVILAAVLLFFILRILTVEDLEKLPWNIILLFGGAMSIGFCLWETGAARWIALRWLWLFQKTHWFLFVLTIAFFVLVMTNFIMNVAAMAISLPVALVLAPYMNVSGAGMPFMLLIGSAPNAIAYESKMFTPGEFFRAGLAASLLLMLVLAVFVWAIWPMMGMPTFLGAGG
jgi:sodium-dependent dicarboxylate transporter 2/3/5